MRVMFVWKVGVILMAHHSHSTSHPIILKPAFSKGCETSSRSILNMEPISRTQPNCFRSVKVSNANLGKRIVVVVGSYSISLTLLRRSPSWRSLETHEASGSSSTQSFTVRPALLNSVGALQNESTESIPLLRWRQTWKGMSSVP